jgi:thymidylate kinase
MVNTKLILIEGLPGSGKTTTGRNLAGEIAQAGYDCQEFFEWSQPHPIDIGDFATLPEFIASAAAREVDLLRQWRAFALLQRAQDTVTVMESRFWQTTAMPMLLGGNPAEDVVQYNQRVIAAIQDLQPVLIYFTTRNVKAALERTIRIKNDEWRREGREESWAERIYKILKPQKWFANRNPQDLGEMSGFFEEWSALADQLYAGTPFPKIKICDPSLDWGQAMREMRVFLDLPFANPNTLRTAGAHK